MAEVGRALRSLSRTMGRRGGIGETLLRAADFGLRSMGMEHQMRLGQQEEVRRKELHDLRKPRLQMEASKAEHYNKPMTLTRDLIDPQSPAGRIFFNTPKRIQ